MAKKDESGSRDTALRIDAKKRLSERLGRGPSLDRDALIHELEVHQVELKMQNDELRKARLEIEKSQEKYFEFYNLAPVGYLTLDETGIISELNLATAEFLGAEKSSLVNKPFPHFILPESQDTFYFHRRQALQSSTKQTCELGLKKNDGTFFHVQLDSIGAEVNGQKIIRAVLTDMTPHKETKDKIEAAYKDLEKKVEERTAALRAEIVERAQTEEALRQSREDLDRAQAVGQIGSWRLDVRRNVLTWSHENHRIFGVPEGTPLSYESFLEIVHPDDRHYVDTQWNAGLRGEPYDIEHRLLVDGQVKWVREKAYLEFDDVGGLLGGFGITQDVTARKQMEEELRRSRDELEVRVQERTEELQRQADLLDLTHDSIMVRDMDDRIVFWNRGAEEQYGWSEKEALGKTAHGLLHTVFPEPLAEIKAGLLSRRRWEGELLHTRKDGSLLTVSSRWALRQDKEGTPTGILEINNDVTEQKKTEKALGLANAYNRKLIEASIDPLVTIDPEGRISDVNAATEQVTGCSRAELIGSDFSDYFTDPEKARDGYRQVFNEGLVRDYQLNIRHRDGHVTPVLYNASVYLDEVGRVIGVFAAARDMTELRQLERQLLQSQKMEAIGTFAGGIAHDFNNMLSAILGFTEMAVEDVTDRPQVTRSLQNVLKSAMRARELVKQILAFSRKAERERSLVSVNPVVKETMRLLRAFIPTSISIIPKITAASDTVFAAPVEIQQIIMNLGANAALAMEKRGDTLEIGLADIVFWPGSSDIPQDLVPGEYLELTVRDNGTGMTPEVKDRLFEPFFTTRREGKGTGMGLSVVYGIVKNLGGAVTVETELGVGSTFQIFLPKVKTETKAEDVQAGESPRGNERILFVDDEQMLVEWGQAVLERLGYTVKAMTDSEKALKVFSANPSQFDLVVTDQTMPRMNGAQLSKKILKIRGNIPIILCTGHSETIYPEMAKDLGIRQFLMKPLVRQELAQAVRLVLDANKRE